jgi:hypothetical protein
MEGGGGYKPQNPQKKVMSGKQKDGKVWFRDVLIDGNGACFFGLSVVLRSHRILMRCGLVHSFN